MALAKILSTLASRWAPLLHGVLLYVGETELDNFDVVRGMAAFVMSMHPAGRLWNARVRRRANENPCIERLDHVVHEGVHRGPPA